jgi:HD-like signal output (HDOD) protein
MSGGKVRFQRPGQEDPNAMNSETLEKILACPSLPSLPAVALRVIELTGDPNVKMSELAKTIQNDQGLAAKVLRTVNSSFYGLRERCANINKALVMLGLSPVKAIVLGFSLVSSVEQKEGDRFDYADYWRRGLYTAVGGKCIVEAAGRKYGDEVFIAGLLQDIGVMAMYRALGSEYLDTLRRCGGDHRLLVKQELSAFEVQHPDIGAMIAQRWKLPDSLIIPVKYHERPTASPGQHNEVVHGVGLGNLIHDTLVSPDPVDARRRLYAKAENWLGLRNDAVDIALERAKAATKEMADLFKLDITAPAQPEALVARAERQLSHVGPDEIASPGAVELLLIDPSDIHPKLGVMGRKGFDWAVRRATKVVIEDKEPAALLNVLIDPPPGAPAPTADSPAIQAAAAVLRKQFTPAGGAICWLGGWVFGVVTVGMSSAELTGSAEEVRLGLSRPVDPGASKPSIVSLGIVHFGEGSKTPMSDPAQIVRSAMQALQASRAVGGNQLKTFEQKSAA